MREARQDGATHIRARGVRAHRALRAQVLAGCAPGDQRARVPRGRKPVATATINAYVHNVLSRCQLYSARAHDAPATINNGLIAEVRAAMARIVRQAPAAATPAPIDKSPVTAFCDRCMRLDPTERERTPSTLMYEQWLAQCGERREAGRSEETFFRRSGSGRSSAGVASSTTAGRATWASSSRGIAAWCCCCRTMPGVCSVQGMCSEKCKKPLGRRHCAVCSVLFRALYITKFIN